MTVEYNSGVLYFPENLPMFSRPRKIDGGELWTGTTVGPLELLEEEGYTKRDGKRLWFKARMNTFEGLVEAEVSDLIPERVDSIKETVLKDLLGADAPIVEIYEFRENNRRTNPPHTLYMDNVYWKLFNQINSFRVQDGFSSYSGAQNILSILREMPIGEVPYVVENYRRFLGVQPEEAWKKIRKLIQLTANVETETIEEGRFSGGKVSYITGKSLAEALQLLLQIEKDVDVKEFADLYCRVRYEVESKLENDFF